MLTGAVSLPSRLRQGQGSVSCCRTVHIKPPLGLWSIWRGAEGRGERERGLKTCTCNKISGRGERERQTDREKGGRGRETETAREERGKKEKNKEGQ